MADKKASPQPQSGADKEEKKDFTQLPADGDKKEVGQDNHSLAPLLHWDTGNHDDGGEE
jgi:hypothetical protein